MPWRRRTKLVIAISLTALAVFASGGAWVVDAPRSANAQPVRSAGGQSSAACAAIRGFYTRSGNELFIGSFRLRGVGCRTAHSVLRALTEGRDLGYRMGPYGRYDKPLQAGSFICRKQKYATQTALVLCTRGKQRIRAVAAAAHTGDGNPQPSAHVSRVRCGYANFYGYPSQDLAGSNTNCSVVRQTGNRWGRVSLARVQRTGSGCDRVGRICTVASSGRTFTCTAKSSGLPYLPRIYCRSGRVVAAWSMSGDV